MGVAPLEPQRRPDHKGMRISNVAFLGARSGSGPRVWRKWLKCPPQNANIFVCQPNGMKFLQQVSDNILGVFAKNNNISNSALLIDIKENVF